MAKPEEAYRIVVVESFLPPSTSGRHGNIHIRLVAGQGLPDNLFVGCSKTLSTDFAVGTKFRIRAKLTDRQSGGAYLYSHPRWPFEVVK